MPPGRASHSIVATLNVPTYSRAVGMRFYTIRCWKGSPQDLETAQAHLNSGIESFAATIARALEINTDELRVCIAENRIGTALLERFRENKATDITC
jgi:hypothetical protein